MALLINNAGGRDIGHGVRQVDTIALVGQSVFVELSATGTEAAVPSYAVDAGTAPIAFDQATIPVAAVNGNASVLFRSGSGFGQEGRFRLLIRNGDTAEEMAVVNIRVVAGAVLNPPNPHVQRVMNWLRSAAAILTILLAFGLGFWIIGHGFLSLRESFRAEDHGSSLVEKAAAESEARQKAKNEPSDLQRCVEEHCRK